MGLLKQKTTYRPTSVEVAFAWILTAGAGLAVAAYLYRTWFGG